MPTPRTLNRWLDINPVVALGRTRTLIVVPSFSVAVAWLGYSDIVASYNYEAPNNFVLTNVASVIPLNPNYLLCISYREPDGDVVRYRLWEDVGEVFYPTAPLYDGQLILKNFRFEVWSTNSTPAVQATDITFITSVLGTVDTMHGSNTNLVDASARVTNFNYSLGLTGPPQDVVSNVILQRFRATVGFVTPNWTSSNDITVISSADAAVVALASGANRFSMMTATTKLTGATSGSTSQDYVFCAFYYDGTAGTILKYDGGPEILTTAANSITINGVSLALNGSNKVYYVRVISNLQISVINISLLSGVIVNGPAFAAPSGSIALDVLGGGNTGGVLEIVSYNPLTDFNGVDLYFYRKYGGYLFSFGFPTNSVSTINV